MSLLDLTRRSFCRIAAACGLTAVAGCVNMGDLNGDGPDGGGGGVPNADDIVVSGSGVVAFRRSGGGRRISNAAKKHNANRLYATSQAALGDPAHPGDNSKVVPVVLSRSRFDELFSGNRMIADLRRLS